MRPLLLPSLPRLWRDATTLQLGVDPDRAVVITPIDLATANFLASLDGRLRLDDLLVEAPSPPDAYALITELVAAGAVVDAEAFSAGHPAPGRPVGTPPGNRASETPKPPGIPIDLAAALLAYGQRAVERLLTRRRAYVLVRCRGQLGPVVAAVLAAAGVGRVVVTGSGVVGPDDVAVGGLTPADVGRPYLVAAAEAVVRAAPDVEIRSPASGRPDAVVLAAGPVPAPADQVRWVGAGVPHLPVLLRDGVALVGPLVIPGRTACLSCVERHRRDRDPAWPVLAAQLATEPRDEPAEAAVVTTAAALAAAEVATALGGAPAATAGVSLEVGPLGAPLRRREWPIHPHCGCVPFPSPLGEVEP